MRLATRLILVVLLAAGIVSPALAQGPWSVFLAGGAAGFGGASTPGTNQLGEVHFKPAPTTRFHAGVARALGRGGLTLDASYAKAGLGGYQAVGSVTLNPGMTLWDIRLLASYELIRLGTSSSIRVALGPMLQSWSGEAIIDTKDKPGRRRLRHADRPHLGENGTVADRKPWTREQPVCPGNAR